MKCERFSEITQLQEYLFNNQIIAHACGFDKSIPPTSDKDCKLGVRTASNAYNEKKYEFYWGYKDHILLDAISGLPIVEITTTANITDDEIAIPSLKDTHSWLPLDETYFIADKGYDIRDIYNFVHNDLHGHCFIPINQ